MKIQESFLRQVIREELLKEKKYAKINEIAVSLPTAGAVAVGVGAAISKLKKVFKNRALRQLTVDFIKKSPQMFGAQGSGRINALAPKITLDDIKDWTSQSDRLDHFGDKKFGVIYRSRLNRSGRKNNIFSINLMISSIKDFNAAKARKIFIEDESFEFDGQDKLYLAKIWRYVHHKDDNFNGGNSKFQLIDTLFYLMVTLYNSKYSDDASNAMSSAEKSLSQILGIEIKFTGKNSWESQADYERDLQLGSSRGPGRGLIPIPDNVARSLDADKLAKIAEVYVKYNNNLTTRLYIPWQFQNLIGTISDIESDIRNLKDRFKFFRKVCSVCFTFMAPGSAKTIQSFLKALSKAVAGDQGMELIIEKLIEKIEKSSLREGKLKEVIKLVISVALSAIA